jgi:biotin carboxyl carrier protein
MTGKISEVKVKEGQSVKTGQVLATLEYIIYSLLY